MIIKKILYFIMMISSVFAQTSREMQDDLSNGDYLIHLYYMSFHRYTRIAVTRDTIKQNFDMKIEIRNRRVTDIQKELIGILDGAEHAIDPNPNIRFLIEVISRELPQRTKYEFYINLDHSAFWGPYKISDMEKLESLIQIATHHNTYFGIGEFP